MITDNNRYEISKLRSCYREWEKHKSPQSNQWFIPLAGGTEFNPSFINCLGDGNIKNIQYIDDPLLRNITAALVEYEANLQARKKVLMTKEFSLLQDVNIFLYRELVPDSFPRWGMRDPHKIKAGWTELIQKELFPKKSIWNVIASISNILGIHTEYLDRQYNNINKNLWNGELCQFDYIPNALHLMRISSDPITAKLIETKLLHDKSKKIIGAIAQYSFSNNQTFCLAATNNNGILRIGKDQLSTCFINQHRFDEKTRWKIIFCQDIRAALILQNIFEKYNSDTMYEFLVTGHLGTNLESFPWDFFYGHDIIFVPAASKFSLSQIGYYKKLFLDADVNEFKIFPGFLLHSPPGEAWTQARERLSPLEAELLRNTLVMDDIKMPLDTVTQIIEKTIPYDKYNAWGQDMGIFKRPKDSVTTISSSALQGLPSPDPSEIPPAPREQEDVVLHHFIRPGSNVLVLGAKNAGKTQFALSVCQALRQQGILCSRFHNEAKVPCKVAYVDAETPLDEFQANLKQYNLDNDDGFYGLSLWDKNTQKLFPDFSLMSQEFRDELQNYLMKNKCRYVVFDNLTSLMGDDVYYGASANKVFKFVQQLQNDGICVFIVHHLTTPGNGSQHGKASGSDIFNRLARTIIELKSQTEILNGSAISETVKKSALQAGLTIGIRFKACKAAPVLEDKTYYAHLPFGEARWKYLGAYGIDGQKIDGLIPDEVIPPTENPQSAAEEDTHNDKLKGLSPDQRHVVEILKASSATRAEIETQIGWGKNKVLAVLQSLIVLEFVRKEGEGKGCYYALNTAE